jgi:erythronate-4-phosphate dehydrogenase
MKIVADPNIPFVREAFAALGEVHCVPGRQMTAADARDAELLLVRSVTPVNAALLKHSRVRFVATATIGTDHIDEPYLERRRIGFASAAGSNANSVAEYIVAALLELAARRKFRLRKKILGVVGVGNVGRRVVRYAEALGMRVLPNDPPRQRAEGLSHFVPLDRVLLEADIVTFHVPLTRKGTDATHHLFGEYALTLLRHKPILINTSRGAVVDNNVLLSAIRKKEISGAVLDVWEHEPHISADLNKAVDIGTPHIAGYSFDGKVAGTRMIYEAASKFFGARPTWQPKLPVVPAREVSVNHGEDDEDVLRRVAAGCYNICADDAALRAAPHAFDRLRAEYPVRREFFNTELELRGAGETLRRKLEALGFKVRG